MVTVLVTDPEQRAALAAVRSLARSKWRVITVGVHRGLAGWSRATNLHVGLSRADWHEPAAMSATVRELVAKHQIDVVLPVTDKASRVLLALDGLPARVAGPQPAAYARASDKATLMQMAPGVGIRVPRQFVLDSAAEIGGLPTSETGAWVLKPARSVVEIDGRPTSLQVRFAESWTDVGTQLAKYPSQAYPIMVQERVIGDGIGVFLLRRARSTLLQFGHRRLREKPPAGGVSTYREALIPPEKLIRRCEALLDQLDYEGPAMIEFKEDSRSGEAVLMEINARLWGSVQLAIDAGVDFPSVLIAATLGLPIPAPRPARQGVRTYWEIGELDHALAIWRKSAAELAAPPGMALGAMAALRALLDRRWSDRAEVFRVSDPMPFMGEILRWITRQ
ncbi:MAG: ATP-grasp domain-containing protein [Gemmatimonadaceae bacterium]|nr:ATP-grasp domain-containing protein [Gemmatimonadaceae bacterium]